MNVASFSSPQPAHNPDWLTHSEAAPPLLLLRDSLFKAVDIFTRDTDIRLVPVVDAADRPVGAVFEKDVRQLLLIPSATRCCATRAMAMPSRGWCASARWRK